MDEFKGKLGNYRIIKTEDETETVWSEYFDEACHNLSGAKAETNYNYIEGCHLLQSLSLVDQYHILDVGFGIGMGLNCLIDFIKLNNLENKEIFYTSIELDEDFALWTLKKYFKTIDFLKVTDNQLCYLKGKINNLSIQIFLGDGRVSLPLAFEQTLLLSIDAIFQDPFSPKKNPTLWTTEWFTFLKNHSAPNVSMATYSSSISIRKSMVEAGWIISNHTGFGTKKTMTKARLEGNIENSLLDQLARSPILSLHDIE